jgi:hypothetical protein
VSKILDTFRTPKRVCSQFPFPGLAVVLSMKEKVEAAATIKGSTARSASLCLLIGAASRDALDPVDVPKPSLGNGNWEQILFGVPKV